MTGYKKKVQSLAPDARCKWLSLRGYHAIRCSKTYKVYGRGETPQEAWKHAHETLVRELFKCI